MKTMLTLTCSVLFLIPACSPEKGETTTRGKLHVLIAESVAPPMIEQVQQFDSLYAKNGAELSYTVLPSEAAIRRLLQDTARFIITTRPMTAAERQRVPAIEDFLLNEILVAYDGIAVLVHQRNRVEEITTSEVGKILSGEISRWDQLSRAKSMRGKIEVLYHDSSDVSAFADVRLLHGQALRKDIRRTSSSLETLRLLADRPLSIGLVGVSWIDSARVPVRSLKVSETEEIADTSFRVAPEAIGKFYSTHPANIYRSYYPLKRAIYTYAFGPVGSLASGFGSFVANKDGQRLLLNRNIVPGTQPIKLRAPE